ncbi:unnamed protein product [Allacma fusca]|uniref:Acyl-coenzyme A thioesterase 13 n=1 Tax=Allacma fusca TaxID=39272 RepID=A0A8J2NQB3_9HEXA|nr:unnamed protein product [Allacma fusca]
MKNCNTGDKYLGLTFDQGHPLLFQEVKTGGGFDRFLENVVVLSAGNGSLSASMKVEKIHVNRGGALHGGMTSTIIDSMSTMALMTYPEVPSPGVSVALNVSFLKAVPEGQEILIRATTDKVGKRLAYLTVDILNKSSGDIVAKGTHTKYIGG